MSASEDENDDRGGFDIDDETLKKVVARRKTTVGVGREKRQQMCEHFLKLLGEDDEPVLTSAGLIDPEEVERTRKSSNEIKYSNKSFMLKFRQD